MGLRPNVSVPQGTLYPNGVGLVIPNADVQATVRPAGTMFRKSVGFESIRPGSSRFQDGHGGLGIHFTPHRYAEDVGQYQDVNGYPLMVEPGRTADVADLPNSDRLDDAGKLTAEDGNANRGVYITEGKGAPVGGNDVRESERVRPEMGDREIGRPLTRSFWEGALRNPAGAFKSEYSDSPLVAVGVAGAIVGVVYMLSRDFERNYRSRRGSSAAGAVAAAPAAAVATAGNQVKDAADVANDAATAAGDAAKAAASAAGDAASAAGKAAEKVTDAVADAVTE